VHEVDRHEVNGAEATINAAHELVHDAPEILVFLHILPRGNSELDKNNLRSVSSRKKGGK
jgi:hypothetical protein